MGNEGKGDRQADDGDGGVQQSSSSAAASTAGSWLADLNNRFMAQYTELSHHYTLLLQQALPSLLGLMLLALTARLVARLCSSPTSWPAPSLQAWWSTWPLAWQAAASLARRHPVATALWGVAATWAAMLLLARGRRRRVYMVDFSCYRPDDRLKCNYEVSEYFTRRIETFTLPAVEFQRKIFLRSGLGDETYIAPCNFEHDGLPRFADAYHEACLVIRGSVAELLNKTGIPPASISILVLNCSLFSPSPSLAAMLVNTFKFRPDVRAFNLAGMGCSASVIACGMAYDMLQTSRREEYALIVSTESITLNWYFGNVKTMLVTNCLFRCGCAAMLLTNKRAERERAKYELQHYVRTHKASEDAAYGCAHQLDDPEGMIAVALNKDLMGVAADALRTNIVRLGPLILPYSEQIHFLFSVLCRHILKLQVKQYQPDFKLAVQHFCLHAGGRAVIDEIQKNLQLNDFLLEPSRAALHRFGNTSASCLWYVFAYMEAKQRIKKGDKVWMLGLGSGFKCNSAIWMALRDIPVPPRSPWLDCIHRYPPSTWTRA